MGLRSPTDHDSYYRLQERGDFSDETIWWMVTVLPLLLVAFFKWLEYVEKNLLEDKSSLKEAEPYIRYVMLSSAVLYFADGRGPNVEKGRINYFYKVLGQLLHLENDPDAVANLLGIISNNQMVEITFSQEIVPVSTSLLINILALWVGIILTRESWDKDKGIWLKIPEEYKEEEVLALLPKKIEIDNWYLSFALGALINLEDPEAVHSYYEQTGQDFERNSDMVLKTKVMKKAWKLMTERVEGGKVIDLGAGTGLAQQTKPETNLELMGLDFAHTMALQAQDHGEAVIEATALEQPFADNTFEGAFCCYFEHYFDTEGKVTLLEETARVLVPEGYLVMTVRYPTKDWRAIYKGVLLESGLKPISFEKRSYSGTHTKKYTIGFIVAQKL